MMETTFIQHLYSQEMAQIDLLVVWPEWQDHFTMARSAVEFALTLKTGSLLCHPVKESQQYSQEEYVLPLISKDV